MNTPDNSTRNITREQFWHQHVNGWRDSGVSKRHYCQQHDLVYHQMIYWCAKCSESNATTATITGGFTQLAVSNVAAGHSAALSIELPNGMTVNNLTPQTIAYLPALLQSL
ncbi:hypothetical protein AB833_21710 [Chromatiales bacterium (ex Bugula neritina AB1)]|nr:hypothetical protein AB833_21710 [Chromatiales bacterium (ex Bugula neritina AB1)]